MGKNSTAGLEPLEGGHGSGRKVRRKQSREELLSQWTAGRLTKAQRRMYIELEKYFIWCTQETHGRIVSKKSFYIRTVFRRVNLVVIC